MGTSIIKTGQIIQKPVVKARNGWEVAFAKMRAENDDQLLIDDVFDNDTLEEWK